MKDIRFEHVSKSFGKTSVISDLNLQIETGERVILLGPSGCGKTTTLRMISGLEDITSGNLYMGGKLVNDVESGDRNIAMVFQNYALFPHMNVFQNIAFGLRTYKLPKEEIKKRVEEIMSVLELTGFEKRLPRQLSGGQRQRVALARAAVKNADYFLLDEPLSNLDAQLRVLARKELVKLHEMNHPTFVYVTHDQIEAMTIGQKVVLMYKGQVQMVDTPYNIYHRPDNVFTARFIGAPPMNIIKVSLEDSALLIGGIKIKINDAWMNLLRRQGSENLLLGIRPEEMQLSDAPGENTVQVSAKYIENYGNRLGIYFDLAGTECIASVEMERGLAMHGKKLYWKVNPEKLSFFDIDTERNIGYPEKYMKKGGKELPEAEKLLSMNRCNDIVHREKGEADEGSNGSAYTYNCQRSCI